MSGNTPIQFNFNRYREEKNTSALQLDSLSKDQSDEISAVFLSTNALIPVNSPSFKDIFLSVAFYNRTVKGILTSRFSDGSHFVCKQNKTPRCSDDVYDYVLATLPSITT